MNKKKKFGVSSALTRGFTETISVVENSHGTFRNATIPISRLELDPDNPRKLAISLEDVIKGLNPKDEQYKTKQEELTRLNELANTIKSSGVINPIVVYKHADTYRVVAGERRTLASILAGKSEIEARVYNEKPTGFILKLVQWTENTAREDLSLFERIDNIKSIIQAYKVENSNAEITPSLLRELTGLSAAQISCYMTVLSCPADLAMAIQQKKLNNLDKAAFIAKIESDLIRAQILEAGINGASLKNLKQLVDQSAQKHTSSKVKDKRGRQSTQVTLGTTKSISVAKTILTSVVQQFKQHHHLFNEVNWNSYESATSAFKRLIKLLEAEHS
jgi:ParB family chromosome partitioning protein